MRNNLKKWLAAVGACAISCLASATVYAAQGPSAVYTVPSGSISYDQSEEEINQYASKTKNGVYHLQRNILWFVSASTGAWSRAYEFPEDMCDSYVSNGILYVLCDESGWNDTEKISSAQLFDLENGTYLRSVTLPGLSGSCIGVDRDGRIYVSGTNKTYDRELRIYDAAGRQLAGGAIPYVEDFNGFLEDGTFFYTRTDNWVYWGYDHDMQTIARGKFASGKLSLESNYLFWVRQRSFTEYQKCAEVLGGKYLMTVDGTVYTASDLTEDSGRSLYIQRGETETSDDRWFDNSGVGVKAFYDAQADLIYAYAMNGNIFAYDFDSRQAVKKFKAAHEVFSFLEFGDKTAAFERDGGQFYVEIIPKSSFHTIETVKMNLNQTDLYRSHTEEEVIKHWLKALLKDDTKIFSEEPSVKAPYCEGTYTEKMKEGLLNYSNYLRWLGGLTPFQWADETTTANAGKGAVVLEASGQFDHEPEKTSNISDMSDEFFEAGRSGTSQSNLSGAYHMDAASYMTDMNGLLADTANIGAYECGHRFTFLQRGGTHIAYGSTDSILVQTVISSSADVNEPGTVAGADNNDYAYPWPGPGAFPADITNTRARWSINLNTDKVDLSNTPLEVTIKDLGTGKVYDRTDTLATSQYMGSSVYFNWFYGACIMFDPPEADSFSGKKYLVTMTNLATPDGDPVELTYEVDFINYEGTHTIDGKEVYFLADGTTIPAKGSVHTVDGVQYKVTKASASDGTVTAVAAADKNASGITIPKTVKIDDITFLVTAIGKEAFRDCKKLEKVTIGENVATIGDKAFAGNRLLKQIVIKSSKLNKLGKDAFKDVAGNAVFTVPDKKMSSYEKLLTKAGMKGTMAVQKSASGKKYTVKFVNGGKTVKTQKILKNQSASAPKLTKKGYVLSWSASFSRVTKNLTVKAVWTPELPKKGYSAAVNGFKYKVTKSAKKNGTVQLTGVSSKKKASYTVPETVKIGKYKFKVTSIAAKAFQSCNKATKISLPKTIASVGKNAFAKVSAKLKISVPKAQYKKISKLIKKSGINKKISIKKR